MFSILESVAFDTGYAGSNGLEPKSWVNGKTATVAAPTPIAITFPQIAACVLLLGLRLCGFVWFNPRGLPFCIHLSLLAK